MMLKQLAVALVQQIAVAEMMNELAAPMNALEVLQQNQVEVLALLYLQPVIIEYYYCCCCCCCSNKKTIEIEINNFILSYIYMVNVMKEKLPRPTRC